MLDYLCIARMSFATVFFFNSPSDIKIVGFIQSYLFLSVPQVLYDFHIWKWLYSLEATPISFLLHEHIHMYVLLVFSFSLVYISFFLVGFRPFLLGLTVVLQDSDTHALQKFSVEDQTALACFNAAWTSVVISTGHYSLSTPWLPSQTKPLKITPSHCPVASLYGHASFRWFIFFYSNCGQRKPCLGLSHIGGPLNV